MKYNSSRKLGKFGPDIAPIGIGAMSFTDFYGPCNDEQANNILITALDLGLNHIDTSNVYGNGTSERRIGDFLAKQGKQKNELFVLATKAAIEGNKIKIHTPLIELTKAEIIHEGIKNKVDYKKTVSCYQASENGLACGKCDSCRLRKEGFRSAQVEDPTKYKI